jgi:hypothetical protein
MRKIDVRRVRDVFRRFKMADLGNRESEVRRHGAGGPSPPLLKKKPAVTDRRYIEDPHASSASGEYLPSERALVSI